MDGVEQGLCHCCGKPAFVEGENYVVTESGCWQWTGSTDLSGYGRLTYRHARYPAHRLSYALVYGAIPDGEVIHHLCENKRCIKPEHLEPVRPRDHFNGHRSPKWYEKMAERRNGNAPAYVDEIRALYLTGRYTQAALCRVYGLSRQHVSKIVKYQIWKAA